MYYVIDQFKRTSPRYLNHDDVSGCVGVTRVRRCFGLFPPQVNTALMVKRVLEVNTSRLCYSWRKTLSFREL